MPRSKTPPEQRLKACIICGEMFNYTGTNSKTCGKHGKRKTCRCATCDTNYIYIYGSKESNFRYCSTECRKNKVKKQRSYGERTCLACGSLFNAQSHNQKLCPAHIKHTSRECVTCGVQFWGSSTGCKKAGKYCSKLCHPQKIKKPKLELAKPKLELKPNPPLFTRRPKGPTGERVRYNCLVCGVGITNDNATSKYCSAHRYYYKASCQYCHTEFHTPRSNPQRYCNEACRLNNLKRCTVCGVEYDPPTKTAIYCPTHAKGGPDANKYNFHWKHGAPTTVGDPNVNPYKVGVVKNCETRKHTECSGKMMVFANQWTECTHCARMVDSSMD